MLVVLLLLCVLFSILTITEQDPVGADAAESLLHSLPTMSPAGSAVLIVGRPTADDSAFVATLIRELPGRGATVVAAITGDPTSIRERVLRLADSLSGLGFVVAPRQLVPLVQLLQQDTPVLAGATVIAPQQRRASTFLLPDNLRNVANQIAVIAIIAIGMTMIIITGGIDLSVGSLVALSAVVAAWLIGHLGGVSATTGAMLWACLGAILLCAVVGVFSSAMITSFRVPPFIATLAMMQVAAGLAYIIAEGKPIYQIPDSFVWLGRGAEPLLKIPHAVILMVILYVVAHLVMSRSTLGRYIYAVGGNSEAARLAGIGVRKVQYIVYTICAMLAGLGGVLMASQLKSGAPTYGLSYELHVIAAVVVGGTSLSGGEGRILGTLIGALVIGVIQNGMNLTNVESYTQKVVLGLVILAAVLLDQLKHGRLFRRVG
jgi:ribose transport system permease protein